MTGEDNQYVSINERTIDHDSVDEIESSAHELSRISNLMQVYGSLVFLLSFAAAGSLVVALAIAQIEGLWEINSSRFGYSDQVNVRSFATVGILTSAAVLFLMVRRDILIRRGQVLSDVLIEETERTSARKRYSQNGISVKVAIRSFAHLKSLPLSSGNSSPVFYVVLSTVALLGSIYLVVVAGY